jgi:hypothetical protein
MKNNRFYLQAKIRILSRVSDVFHVPSSSDDMDQFAYKQYM